MIRSFEDVERFTNIMIDHENPSSLCLFHQGTISLPLFFKAFASCKGDSNISRIVQNFDHDYRKIFAKIPKGKSYTKLLENIISLMETVKMVAEVGREVEDNPSNAAFLRLIFDDLMA